MLPTLRPVTSPWLPEALLTCAIAPLPDVQVTCVVRSWVVSSLKLPVAVSCTVVPLAIEGSGNTVIETKVAEVTVIVPEPCRPWKEAVMVAVPTAAPVTSPLVGDVLLTVATPLEAQVASLVQSWVVPSLRLQVAVSWTVVPLAIVATGTVMVMELTVAGAHGDLVDPAMPLRVAVRGVFATPAPVTSPRVPGVVLTVAIPVLPELQVTWFVRS